MLIPIDGTEEGNNMQAMPVHIKCMDLRLTSSRGGADYIIYQVFEKLQEDSDD